ncbi:MAG TPA: electron transport complex subunit RsxE [Gemmatimonadaceae bacterium]|nr:electron transport complex subunit RsxE [Gemmatimonadaceae bacterium]
MRTVPPPDIPGQAKTTAAQDFLSGIWKENPVLVMLLGMCPTMAITNNVKNSIAMGVVTGFVLILSSIVVSMVRNVIRHEVRVVTFILVIATFVQMADILTEAIMPSAHKALGAFIPLIIGNCMLLGRQEAFSSRNTVWRSALDGTGMSIGFTIGLMMVGSVREILGSGTWLGFPLMPPSFEPWVIMNLPPGGFFGFGLVLIALAWWYDRQKRLALIDRVTAASREPTREYGGQPA